MKPWLKAVPDEVIKIGWRTLVKKIFIRPDGESTEFLIKDENGSLGAAVVALTPDGKVIVAEEFRPGPEKVMLELPGGAIAIDEDPKAAVMRELREETGYTSDEVELIGEEYKDAYTNTKSMYYMAKNCTLTHEQELDSDEFISVRLISIDELIASANSSGMTDTGALFFAYDQLMEVKKGQK